MKYDFDNIDFQIEQNENRLARERERYSDYRNRITIISIFYTIYAGFTFQLLKFAFIDNFFLKWYFGIPFSVYLILFLLSVYNTFRLLIPKKIAHSDLPNFFYDRVKKMYENQNNVPQTQIKYYIRETYKKQLEKSVSLTFNLCNKQSRFNYWSLVFALSALIPYMICVGVKLTKAPEDVTKIEIIKPK